MIKIGLVGACDNSRIYADLIKQNTTSALSGIFDENIETSKLIADQYNCIYCSNYDHLLKISDAIIVVSTFYKQFVYASKAIRTQKHLFLSRALFQKLTEAKELLKIAEEANVKIAVGQTERYNQAFVAIQSKIKNPLFIETDRCRGFNANTKEIDVVADLMIHDIDLILSLVKSNVKKVVANGVAVNNEKIDIANARVEFENGCIANLTTNRITLQPIQKMTIFQKDAYINLNFLKRRAQVVNLSKSINGSQQASYTIESGSQTEKKYVYNLANNPIEINAIQHELNLFINSILKDTEPPVSIFNAYNALDLAHLIIKKIKNNSIVAK